MQGKIESKIQVKKGN